MSKISNQHGIYNGVKQILRPVPVSPSFVCRYSLCSCGWSIYSTPLLLFISSLLTFCVASSSVPTTVASSPALGPTTTSPTPPLKPSPTHIDSKIIIAISVSALLVLLVLVVMACFTKFFRSKRSRRRAIANNTQVGSSVEIEKRKTKDFDVDDACLVKKYSWVDIERLSGNFSRVVGSGGFSTVYMADSIKGAIKIHFGSERLHEVFRQELDILLRLSHDNIVKLLGYCDDTDDQGALVFEYVPNGSLHEKLHESGNVLSWRSRMTIAFQLVQAIEYLHEKCSLQIVHGDIKASNILLDEYMNCKLCDFGSAKMGFSSIVMPSSSVACPSRTKQTMVGSPGYTDPHYLRTGIASKKNDVYSFGVIILELVTGMEAFCPERQRGQLLTSIVGPTLKSVAGGEQDIDVAEMVDPKLGGDLDLEEAKTMLSIAALCLGNSPILRPSATQILQTMKDHIYSISFLALPTQLPLCK